MNESDPIRTLVRRAVHEAMEIPSADFRDLIVAPAQTRRSNRLRVVAVVPLLALVAGGFSMLRERSTTTVAAQKSRPKIVFPVDAPFNFTDTFGAPRMTGTPYAHKHQGADIFAKEGSPIRALADGVVFNVGVAKLGGNKLWLRTSGGTCFYYALIGKFSASMTKQIRPLTTQTKSSVSGDEASAEVGRTEIRAGTILGWAASSGSGVPTYVHVEVRPNCGDAVNPMPVLNALKRGDVKTFEKLTRA
jgi:Peptidase family M23